MKWLLLFVAIVWAAGLAIQDVPPEILAYVIPAVLALALLKIEQIPYMNHGIFTLFNLPVFKKRGGLAIHTRFTKLKAVNFEPKKSSVTVTVYTKGDEDGGQIGFDFTVNFETVPDYDNLGSFLLWEKGYAEHIKDMLSSQLANVVIEYDPVVVLSRRGAVELYFNCLCRLSDQKIPHLHGTEYHWPVDHVTTADILVFYSEGKDRADDIRRIREILKKEDKDLADKSRIEEEVGTDFKGLINLSTAKLTEETRQAFAKKREVRATLDIPRMIADQAKKIAEATGMDIKDAMELVLSFQQDKRYHTHRVVGSAGPVGILVNSAPERESAPRPQQPKGGKGGK